MTHLTTESLARLVDEPATSAEQAHLEQCAACSATLAELRVQTTALAALPSYAPPADEWNAIAARLRDDHRRRDRWFVNLGRVAAAIALIAVGAASQAALSASRAARAANEGAQDTVNGAPATRGGVAVDLISAGAPKTLDEATSRLRVAETMYQRALLDYASLASPQPPQDAVARLATLEAIVLTTRAALERAPADPLINTYHLAAQAERESLLGQLRRRSEAGQWY